MSNGEKKNKGEGGKRKRREEEEKKFSEDIEKKIDSLPEDHVKCEGEIRELEKTITACDTVKIKEKLLYKLKSVSCRALSDDLKTMMEQNGLALEGLTLVMKYLTTVPELAQHLYLTSTDVLDGEGLGIVKRRLGPSLEVLGGLKFRGIDVRKQWVKRLIEKAPSLHSLSRLSAKELQSLCKTSPKEKEETEEGKGEGKKEGKLEGKSDESGEKASEEEMDEVRRLANVAKAYNKQTFAVPPDVTLPSAENNPDNKTVDKQKLEEVKKLMNEAKEKASEQSEEAKTATKDKMEEMMKLLELPSDWNKQDIASPDQMLKELDGIIDQYSNVLEAVELYKSDLEVVAKASGGRALCGIHYSKYERPRTAGRPILSMPANITLSNPNVAMKLDYLKFSESRAAVNYVHTVKSSSTSIGFSVSGFYGGFAGEVQGAYSSQKESDKTRSVKSHSTSASVVQLIWTAKKCFHIEQEHMMLSREALKKAKAIANEDDARLFMEIFGSHIPAGIQTLGGVFFTVADVESGHIQKVTTLTNAATEKLEGKLSLKFGFLGGAFGIGGSVKVEHQRSSGEKEAEQQEDQKNSYSFTVHTMGPAVANPVMFQKLLSHNSTWALIDRGPDQAYIPVWELLTDLDSDYEGTAKVLLDRWKEEESMKKEHRRKEDIRMQLMKLKDEYDKREPEKDYGFWPSTSEMVYAAYKLEKEFAFDKAIELIMENPIYNICEICQREDRFFTLRCFRASEDKMDFESSTGHHFLFYSNTEFKWKEDVPVKLDCKE